MYEEVLSEVDTVTDKLNKVQTDLWETQDELKEAKVYKLRVKAHERLSTKNKETIKTLELNYGNSLTKERTTQDALDLMKKVFTRTQLKARDDQTALQKLKEKANDDQTDIQRLMEKNRLLAKELQKLKEKANDDQTAIQKLMSKDRLLAEENSILLQSLNFAEEELLGAEKMTAGEKDKLEKLVSENFEVEKKLADKLKETKRDLETERTNQRITEKRGQKSEKRMEASKNRLAEKAATVIEEQQEEIKRLKKQLGAVEEQKEEAEVESEASGVDYSAAALFSQWGVTACNPSLGLVAT
jgi:hypothetical protein